MNRICTICNKSKPIEEFGTYLRHSGKGKRGTVYIRYQCIKCCNTQKKEYKLKKKMERMTLSFTVVEIPTRYCSHCHLDLPLDKFNKNQNYCKECQHQIQFQYRRTIRGRTKEIAKQRDRGENGYGLIVGTKPGFYETELAKTDTFWAMKILGWTYNEDTGIWWKKGIKDCNGVFEFQKKRNGKLEEN